MKKKILSLAVAAGLTGVVASTAQAAMHVNDKGMGEALVYPFFSTQGGNDTYVHVVNTTGYTKAVKVRFIEARNSREVLDFNLYLSPEDEWAAAIVATENGGAMVQTVDNSCTVPELGTSGGGHTGSQEPAAGGKTLRKQNFVNFAYDLADEEYRGLDRTTEGYIEIIEMGQLDPVGDGFNSFGSAAVHDGSGVPVNCADIRGAWNTSPAGAWTLDSSAQFLEWGEDPNGTDAGWSAGGLWGYGVVINVADGTSVGYDATAIDNFVDPGAAFPGDLHYRPGFELPSLAEAQPVATIFDGTNGVAQNYTFTNEIVDDVEVTGGAKAVSALFMSDTISNDYVIDPAINASTDWVVTMPTKRFFVDDPDAAPDATVAAQPAVAPFNETWSDHSGDDLRESACEPVGMEHWDREEAYTEVNLGSGFSPQPPQIQTPDFVLCTEVSIVQFGEESALHGSEYITYGFTPNYTEGWARMSFQPGGLNLSHADARLLEADAGTFVGLPVIGFAALNYQNGNVGGALSNYAAGVTHKSTQQVTPALQ